VAHSFIATSSRTLVSIALLWLVPMAPVAFADSPSVAATAQFVSGTVTLVAPDGNREPVERGKELHAGETLLTGDDGRIHLRFEDGGFVSLIPNSEFRIEAYAYSGTLDGTERLSMRLLKGGLRTMTGRIGKLAQEAYEMATRAATIGIRGTEYTLLYQPDDTLSGSVAEGKIAVCNNGGCLDVIAGHSFAVLDAATRPALIEKAAELGAPPRDDKAHKSAKETETADAAGQSSNGKSAKADKPDDKAASSGKADKLDDKAASSGKADKLDEPVNSGKADKSGKLADARGNAPAGQTTTMMDFTATSTAIEGLKAPVALPGSPDADTLLRTRVSDLLLQEGGQSDSAVSKAKPSKQK
jgi:hypothetical protein